MAHLSTPDRALARGILAPASARPAGSSIASRNHRILARTGTALAGFAALLAMALQGNAVEDGALHSEQPAGHRDPGQAQANLTAALAPAARLPPVEVLLAALDLDKGEAGSALASLEAFFLAQDEKPQSTHEPELTGPLDLSNGFLARSIGVSDPAIAIGDITVAFDGLPVFQLEAYSGVLASFDPAKPATAAIPDPGTAGDEDTGGDTDMPCPVDPDGCFHITLVDGDTSQVFHFDRETGEGFLHDELDSEARIFVPQELLDQLLLAAGGEENATVDVSELEEGFFPGDGPLLEDDFTGADIIGASADPFAAG